MHFRRSALAAVTLALGLACCATAHARTFVGYVTHVSDGDSIWVKVGDTAPREVRLQGIDAPEICQQFGREAREALISVVLHRDVLVATRARDRYERIVARVSVGSQDLGSWLVARGWAWSDGWRGSGGPYARQQQHAMANGLGLWMGHAPMPPREFRRRHGRCG